MALFYWIIEVKGFKKWTFFLVVIGMNAVTIWVGQRFIDFKYTSDAIFLGVSKYFGILQPLFLAICLVGIKWLFLWFLYKKNIFLKGIAVSSELARTNPENCLNCAIDFLQRSIV